MRDMYSSESRSSDAQRQGFGLTPHHFVSSYMHVLQISIFLPRAISGIMDQFHLVKLISIEPDLLGDWVGAVRIAGFWVIYVDTVQLCC